MDLIKLKAVSRKIYGELHSITEKIEHEMKSSDTLLVDLNRMESEISSMKRTLLNYQSFSCVNVKSSHGIGIPSMTRLNKQPGR